VLIPVQTLSELQEEVIITKPNPANLPKDLPQQIKLDKAPVQPAADLSSNLKGDEFCKLEQNEEKTSIVTMEEDADKSREAIKAARLAKKAAKKNKEDKKDKPKTVAPAANEPKTQVAPPVKIAPASAGKENKATPAQTQTISQENKVNLEPSQKSSKEKENKASAEQTQKSSKELKEERRLKQVFNLKINVWLLLILCDFRKLNELQRQQLLHQNPRRRTLLPWLCRK
jgi:hypothetical protein